ncbi:MAG: DUF423 domain-containing protein [Chitinophagales bacterium]|nr:DUF423 domain-containing protein [Chitinophagales bacterium]
MSKRFLIAGAFFACTAVMLGAFGAHGLSSQLGDSDLHVFHTAVEYQFYHALCLLFIGFFSQQYITKLITIAGNLFIAGIILFSGSLYILSIAALICASKFTWIGILTPIGGFFFIAGWILMLYSFWKIKLP